MEGGNVKIAVHIIDPRPHCLQRYRDALLHYGTVYTHTSVEAAQRALKQHPCQLLIIGTTPAAAFIGWCVAQKEKMLTVVLHESAPKPYRGVFAFAAHTHFCDLIPSLMGQVHTALCLQLQTKSVQEKIGIIQKSPAMQDTMAKAAQYAQSSLPLLLYGEPNTGKKQLARWIHQHAPNALGPYIEWTKGTPQPLTATCGVGLFDAACGGTLVIDQLEYVPLAQQKQLHTMLQSNNPKPRCIATLSIDPGQAIQENILDDGLYKKIAHDKIFIPPLRLRQEDLPSLAQMLYKKCIKKRKNTPSIENSVWEKAKEQHWEDNLRGLEDWVTTLLYTGATKNFAKEGT